MMMMTHLVPPSLLHRATYLAGELLCSQNDMVRLSAILCQITKGDYVTHRWEESRESGGGEEGEEGEERRRERRGKGWIEERE